MPTRRSDAGLATVEPLEEQRPLPPEPRAFDLVDGPWMNDQWMIVEVGGSKKRRSQGPCAIQNCDTELFVQRDGVRLCYGHYHMWRRQGRPALTTWALQPWPEIQKKANPQWYRTFSFDELPPAVRDQIRYVAGVKFTNGDWTPTQMLRLALEGLRETVLQTGATTLLDPGPEAWIEQIRRVAFSHRTDKQWEHNYRPYIRSFFKVLGRGTVTDPWAEDFWAWRNMFDRVLGGGEYSERTNIHWETVEQLWLRNPLREYTRQCLVAGIREWGTVVTWANGFQRLSDFLSRHDIEGPAQLDRRVFLLFLEEQRIVYGGSRHSMQLVNTVASVLSTLKMDDFQPELGAEIYLRPGENAATQAKNPRPWPRDVVGMIESRLLENEELDPTIRLMLRFCRWGGPRVGELLALPIGALRENGRGGYWIRYWMPKAKAHREFPVPHALGVELAKHQKHVIDTYGPAAEYFFPSSVRSNQHAQVTRPFSSTGFARRVAKLFTDHGILRSGITGELISGADIHRFRHTIGTELLNNGWTQQEVMQFLGHSSPTMTSAYAKILDETLNKKIDEYHRKVEQERADSDVYAEPAVERLRDRITAVTPTGYCTLPADQACSVRDNPCLTCPFHARGDGAFDESRGVYRTQLKTIVRTARKANNDKVADLNERILASLDDEEAAY